jgi:hypothetical protein
MAPPPPHHFFSPINYSSILLFSTRVNKYHVDCGFKNSKSDTFGLAAWEEKGWIAAQDPYGWFMWYCRFFLGRRTNDDDRQVSRFLKCAGPKGRWRGNLVAKCLRDGKPFDDPSVSPVVRQTLHHWGYQLTQADFSKSSDRVMAHGATYFPRSELSHVVAPGKISDHNTSKRKRSEEAAGTEAETDSLSRIEQMKGRDARSKRRVSERDP